MPCVVIDGPRESFLKAYPRLPAERAADLAEIAVVVADVYRLSIGGKRHDLVAQRPRERRERVVMRAGRAAGVRNVVLPIEPRLN